MRLPSPSNSVRSSGGGRIVSSLVPYPLGVSTGAGFAGHERRSPHLRVNRYRAKVGWYRRPIHVRHRIQGDDEQTGVTFAKKSTGPAVFFSRKRTYNRARVLWLSLASTSLSALATAAIGATRMLSLEWLQLVALVATAGTSPLLASGNRSSRIASSGASITSRGQTWIGIERLIDYRTAASESLTEAEVDEFFKQFDQILTNADQAWVDTYTSK